MVPHVTSEPELEHSGLRLHAPALPLMATLGGICDPPPIQVHLPKLKFMQKTGGEGALGRTAVGASPEEHPKPSKPARHEHNQHLLSTDSIRPVQHWTSERCSPPWSRQGGRWVNGSSSHRVAVLELPCLGRSGKAPRRRCPSRNHLTKGRLRDQHPSGRELPSEKMSLRSQKTKVLRQRSLCFGSEGIILRALALPKHQEVFAAPFVLGWGEEGQGCGRSLTRNLRATPDPMGMSPPTFGRGLGPE